MKSYIKVFALAALALGATAVLPSCSEDSIFVIDPYAVPQAGDYADNMEITVDQETNIATFRFTGSGVTPVWIIDGKNYSTSFEFTKYFRKAGTYNVEMKIANGNGMSQGTLKKEFTVNKTKMTGFGGYKYETDFNLWAKCTLGEPAFYYANGDWSQRPNPAYKLTKEEIQVTLPQATNEKWQAQMHVKTNISLKQGESYDGSFIVTSTVDMKNITVKIHPDGDDDDAHSFYPQQKVSVTAGEPQAFWFSNLPAAVDMNNVVVTFDFGGNPDNSEFLIENFVIKNHKDDDGTVVPEPEKPVDGNWVDFNSADNLWYGCEFEKGCWYAPGWSQIADPEITFEGKNFSVMLPQGTTDQWQAQVFLTTNVPIPDIDTAYDFKVTLKSDKDHPGVTIKLTEADDNFFFAERVALKAGSPTTFVMTNVKAIKPMEKLKIFFDFGGNAAETKVEITNMIFQKHHD